MELIETIGILDIIFIGILVISVVVGLIRGAIREILSLVGLFLSVYLAFKFSDTLAKNYVSRVFESEHISYITSFILIVVGTIFAIALVNLLISQLLKASGLSWFDRILGVVFGLLRGGVICVIIVTVLGLLPSVTSSNWWMQSTLAPIFKEVASMGTNYMPESVAKYFDSGKKVLDQQVDTIKQSIGTGQAPATDNDAPRRPNMDGSTNQQSQDALEQKLKELEQKKISAEDILRANGIELESTGSNPNSQQSPNQNAGNTTQPQSQSQSQGQPNNQQAQPQNTDKPILESYIE